MDIFEIEPTLAGVPSDFGNEPSLRTVLIHYYSQAFAFEKAAKYADIYIAAMKEQAE